MITFALHGYEGVDPAHEFGLLKAEFEKRGVPCMIGRSPRAKTKTPNQDRAKIMVEALRGVEGDVALVGISNQGLFKPLVAAARPIMRIVFINAAIPRPGKSFWETSKEQRVLASFPARILAWLSPGMHEVCRLAELLKAEYVYISAEHDEAIRSEWEQRAAREYLHVEPVVIAGAGHSDFVLGHVSEVVDAATLQRMQDHQDTEIFDARHRHRVPGRCGAANGARHHAFYAGISRGDDGDTCRGRHRYRLGRRAVSEISAMTLGLKRDSEDAGG
jgi:hypothetical protein